MVQVQITPQSGPCDALPSSQWRGPWWSCGLDDVFVGATLTVSQGPAVNKTPVWKMFIFSSFFFLLLYLSRCLGLQCNVYPKVKRRLYTAPGGHAASCMNIPTQMFDDGTLDAARRGVVMF